MPETPPHPESTPLRAQAGRWRNLRNNILLSILSTAVLLICIETGLRLTDLAPTETLAYPDEAMWARNPGPFAPDQDFIDRFRPSLPHHIHINSLGFRGRDFTLAKPPGTYRVLCLGDSYVFGDYVNDDETFPAALERKLRLAFPGRRIEAVNAGVNGYTISDEDSLAEEKGFALKPDLTLVGFVLNDLADLTRKVSSRENQRQEARELSTSPFTPVKNLLRRTATYNFLFVIKATILGRLRLDPTIQDLPIRHLLHPPYDERTEELFEKYRQSLVRLDEAASGQGSRLAIVLFPFYEQVVGDAPAEAQARMTRMAGEAGIPVVDLLPAFRRSGSRAAKLFLMPLDHHPSAAGHRLAAREVSRLLQGMLERAIDAGGAPPVPVR